MRKRIFNVILFNIILFLAIFLCLNFLDFINFECFYLKYLHIYCAGCGGTRMVKALLNLRFYEAFRFNPLLFILLIVEIIFYIYSTFIYIKKGKIIFPKFRTMTFIAFLLLTYMVLRNIPYFSFLRPI